MPNAVSRCTARAAACALALIGLLAGAGARAQVLPPDRPKVDYSIIFTFERHEAGFAERGSRRITVDGVMVRDETLGGDDHTVYLADRAAGTVLSFNPKDPARKAVRTPLGKVVLPMADGYRPLLELAGRPEVLGTETIAANTCTRLVWQGPGADIQDWCVTQQGIPLRASRKAGLSGISMRATGLVIGPADPALMRLPPGFSIVDQAP